MALTCTHGSLREPSSWTHHWRTPRVTLPNRKKLKLRRRLANSNNHNTCFLYLAQLRAESLASHCCHFFLGLPTLRLHMHIDMTNSFQAATCSGPLAFAWLPNETGSLLAETPRNFRPVSWITRSNLQLHFESSAVRSILCRRSAIREANTLVAGFSA